MCQMQFVPNANIVKMLQACSNNALKHYDNHCECNALSDASVKNVDKQLLLMLRVLQPHGYWKNAAQHVAQSLDTIMICIYIYICILVICFVHASVQTVANAIPP